MCPLGRSGSVPGRARGLGFRCSSRRAGGLRTDSDRLVRDTHSVRLLVPRSAAMACTPHSIHPLGSVYIPGLHKVSSSDATITRWAMYIAGVTLSGCGEPCDSYGATIVKRTVRILLLLIPWTLLGQQYDVLIRNGRVVDGTGNPWVYADVGVTRDRITLVGRAPVNATAKRVIDAKGMVVAPGFIDMLEQSEWTLLIDKEAFSKLTQGITTGITGEGGSIAPQNEQTQADRRDFLEHYHLTVDWHDLDGYFSRLERQGEIGRA